MDSIVQKDKECLVCGTVFDLHSHHIFYGTANRKQSEKYGLKCWLCARHHNMSDAGVHFDKDLDTRIKMMAQLEYESQIGSREEFIKVFGRNYLDL